MDIDLCKHVDGDLVAFAFSGFGSWFLQARTAQTSEKVRYSCP